MPVVDSDSQAPAAAVLSTSREPSVRRRAPLTVGEQAFNDALLVVAVSWVIVILLAFSLRRHNV